MARRSLYDIANRTNIGLPEITPGVGLPSIGLGRDRPPSVAPIGGGTRGEDYSPPTVYDPGPEYGQQQWGPGTQSDLSNWVDYYGGGGGTDWSGSVYDSFFDLLGITSMSDLSDWWENSSSGWAGADDYDSFYDWLTQGMPGGYGEGGQSTPAAAVGSPWYGQTVGFGQEGQYGGGAQGGAGDLGTGNVFIGGGMGSSMFGEGMTGQDCATLGPQFNSAGECIACCEDMYAGEGFYGTGEEWESEGTIDPEQGTDCIDMYNSSGGFDMTQMSYSEFEMLYCP